MPACRTSDDYTAQIPAASGASTACGGVAHTTAGMPPTVASSTVDAGIFVVHASHFFDQFGDDRRVVRAGVLVSTAPPVDRQHLPQEPAFRVQVTVDR
jgi:hypothetical protein